MYSILKLITGTLCSRILGFLRDIIFFAILGSSLEASAFLIAFAIPNLFRRLCGEGALNSVFIPVFAQRYIQKPHTAPHFLNIFFTRFGIYLGISILCAMYILAILHHYIGSHKWATVLFLTNAMLPYLWFICTAALLNGALNVFNAFSLTAFSPIFLNLSMLGGLWLGSFSAIPIKQVSILAVCVIIGGWLQWFLPKIQLKRKGFPIHYSAWENDPDISRIWQLFLPSVLGAAVFQINAMLGRFFAYTIDEHAVSALYLANRFLELPLGLFAFAIISTLLPKLSLYSAQKNDIGAQQLLKNGISLLLLLLLPAAVGLYFLAEPMMDLCFCWGRFSFKDTQNIVPLLKIFSIGLPIFGLSSLLTRVFYAQKNTQTPVKIASLTLINYALCAYILTPYCGIQSLAAASVISTLGQFILQYKIIQKKYPTYGLTFKTFCGKFWICLIFFAVLLGYSTQYFCWTHQKFQDAFTLTTCVILFFFIYLTLLFCLDKKSFKQLTKLNIENV